MLNLEQKPMQAISGTFLEGRSFLGKLNGT